MKDYVNILLGVFICVAIALLLGFFLKTTIESNYDKRDQLQTLEQRIDRLERQDTINQTIHMYLWKKQESILENERR